MHYVYIIQSQLDGTYYKGYSSEPLLRLQYHNEGKSSYTKTKLPWCLVGIFYFTDKREALQKEKKLKKYPTISLQALLRSEKNQLQHYLAGCENR